MIMCHEDGRLQPMIHTWQGPRVAELCLCRHGIEVIGLFRVALHCITEHLVGVPDWTAMPAGHHTYPPRVLPRKRRRSNAVHSQ